MTNQAKPNYQDLSKLFDGLSYQDLSVSNIKLINIFVLSMHNKPLEATARIELLEDDELGDFLEYIGTLKESAKAEKENRK